MSYINKSALKQFILEKIQKTRPGWKCNRVAGNAASLFDHKVEEIIVNHEKITYNEIKTEAELIVKSKVKKRMLEVHNANHPWYKSTYLSPDALNFVESELEKSIIRSIEIHPSGCGKTFKP